MYNDTLTYVYWFNTVYVEHNCNGFIHAHMYVHSSNNIIIVLTYIYWFNTTVLVFSTNVSINVHVQKTYKYSYVRLT